MISDRFGMKKFLWIIHEKKSEKGVFGPTQCTLGTQFLTQPVIAIAVSKSGAVFSPISIEILRHIRAALNDLKRTSYVQCGERNTRTLCVCMLFVPHSIYGRCRRHNVHVKYPGSNSPVAFCMRWLF